jgi:DNA-binding MarR family transcriptional regulator
MLHFLSDFSSGQNCQSHRTPLTSPQQTPVLSAAGHVGVNSKVRISFDIIKPLDRTETTRSRTARSIERALEGYAQIVELMSATRPPEFPDSHVTMAQMRVLMVLSAIGEARMSDLAHQLGIAPSTLSSVVDRLVEAGLATRKDDPRDRRSVVVALAPAGARMLDQFSELGTDALRSLLEQVPDKDIVTVNKAIELLVAAARRLSEDPR